MSTAAHRHLSVVFTRDAIMRLSDDDCDLANGSRNIPVPSTAGRGWLVVDSEKNNKTGWLRVHYRGHA
jgi:hypothetical protein